MYKLATTAFFDAARANKCISSAAAELAALGYMELSNDVRNTAVVVDALTANEAYMALAHGPRSDNGLRQGNGLVGGPLHINGTRLPNVSNIPDRVSQAAVDAADVVGLMFKWKMPSELAN